MTVGELPAPVLAEQPLVVLCPHCEFDSLRVIDLGPDLRTITALCKQCGQVSVITVSA
jgi:hypothetical protein